MRIIFAGTSDFAVRHLNVLISSNYQIVGVFTQPDRPSGRGKKIMFSPVKSFSNEKGLPVFQPISWKCRTDQKLIADLNADIMVVVSYGMILPRSVLVMPRLGCINVHGSLLPRWRGAAPIQHAILAGDSKTGITIIQINTGIDTGDILYKMTCPITAKDTSTTLYAKLADLGQRGLIKTLQKLEMGTIIPEVQDDKLVTYAKKINREEARINWSLPAIQLERCIRAFNPWPVSWITVDRQPVKIWKASVINSNKPYPYSSSIKRPIKPGTLLAVGKDGIAVATVDGILNMESFQPAGKKIMNVQDFLNFHRAWFSSKKRICFE